MALSVNGTEVVSDTRNIDIDYVAGTYTKLRANYSTDTAVTGTKSIDCRTPMHMYTLTGNTAFSFGNLSTTKGAVIHVMIYTNTSAFTPSFSNVQWPDDNEPYWQSHKVWLLCLNNTDKSTPVVVRGTAVPYDDQD